jgi:hypothetical protein
MTDPQPGIWERSEHLWMIPVTFESKGTQFNSAKSEAGERWHRPFAIALTPALETPKRVTHSSSAAYS